MLLMFSDVNNGISKGDRFLERKKKIFRKKKKKRARRTFIPKYVPVCEDFIQEGE